MSCTVSHHLCLDPPDFVRVYCNMRFSAVVAVQRERKRSTRLSAQRCIKRSVNDCARCMRVRKKFRRRHASATRAGSHRCCPPTDSRRKVCCLVLCVHMHVSRARGSVAADVDAATAFHALPLCDAQSCSLTSAFVQNEGTASSRERRRCSVLCSSGARGYLFSLPSFSSQSPNSLRRFSSSSSVVLTL